LVSFSSRPSTSTTRFSGTAYFDPRFHWTDLKVHTQVVSHNNPQENRPPLRKYVSQSAVEVSEQ